MNHLQADVLVVGAGLAGLSMMRALEGLGLVIAIVDDHAIAVQSFDGLAHMDTKPCKVSAISCENQQWLDDLGVWQALPKGSFQPYTRMQVWDAHSTGRVLFDAPTHAKTDTLGWIVANQALMNALINTASATESVHRFTETRVATIETITEASSCRHRVYLESGQIITTSLLIGADGVQSTVRKHCGFKTRQWSYDHQALVATIAVEHPHQKASYQWFTKHGPLAFLPLPSDETHYYCSIVWSVSPDFAESFLEKTSSLKRQTLAQASAWQLGEILHTSAFACVDLKQCHAVDYVKPGVALVADAAHTIHPLAGQGINLGLRDIAELAQVLRQAGMKANMTVHEAVLQRYQRARKTDNIAMMLGIEGIKRLFDTQTMPAKLARALGMGAVNRLDGLKKTMVNYATGGK